MVGTNGQISPCLLNFTLNSSRGTPRVQGEAIGDDLECSFAVIEEGEEEEIGDSFFLFGREGLNSPIAVRANTKHRVSLGSSGALHHSPSSSPENTSGLLKSNEERHYGSEACKCKPKKSWSRSQVAHGLSMSMFIGMFLGAVIFAILGLILFAQPKCDWFPSPIKNNMEVGAKQQQLADDVNVGLAGLIAAKLKNLVSAHF